MSESVSDGSGGPLSLPKADLISVEDESLARAELLESVTVTEQGVAVCENTATGTIMRLAGVRLDADEIATQVPFTLNDGQLILPLPADRPSRIGFFLGHNRQRTVMGAFRFGSYPGDALVTANTDGTDNPPKEIMIGLEGIRLTERAEQRWASQTELFDELGFDPAASRGFFARIHQPSPHTSQIIREAIVIVPSTTHRRIGTAAVVGPWDKPFQILGFGAQNSTPGGRMISVPIRSSYRGSGIKAKINTEPTPPTVILGTASIESLVGAFEVAVALKPA